MKMSNVQMSKLSKLQQLKRAEQIPPLFSYFFEKTFGTIKYFLYLCRVKEKTNKYGIQYKG